MELNFDKMNGLIPAIIQDNSTRTVLMLGFMNQEAYQKTIETGKVTFFSRTRNQLWTKGETSGHYLDVVSISADCDQDTLLIKVNPHGPVCHTGADTCWNERMKRKTSCSSRNCRTSSTNGTKKCPRNHIPPAFSAPA